jgi:PAS domain S-box-containing protein
MTNASNYLIQAFDIIPLPCIIIEVNTLNLTIKNVNKAFISVTNTFNVEELTGKNLDAIFVNTDHEQNRAIVDINNAINATITTKQSQKIAHLKLYINHQTNAITTWSVEHTPMLDEKGRVACILLSFSNIPTTSLHEQQNLEQSNTNLNGDHLALQAETINRIKNNQAAIINSTDDIIFSVDIDFKLVAINTSYQQLLLAITGRLENEGDQVLTGRLGKELTDKWKSYFERAFNGEKYSIQEEIFNPFKGIKQYGLINFNPVYNTKGEVEAVACFAKDITAATVSYLELEKSKIELEKIFTASLDVICAVDENNIFRKVSPASKIVWGYEPEEMIGHSIFEFIHPDYFETTHIAVKKIKESNSTINFENQYIRKDGSIGTIEWNSSWDAKEQIRFGVARDITEKKKIELALLESNLRYHYVTKATSDAIYDWNLEENAVFVSDIFTEVFGWSIEQCKTQISDWPNFIHPDDRDKIVKGIREDIAGNATKWRYEYRFLKPNGQFVHVVDKAFIIRNTNGKVVRIVGAKRDVTKRVEELLRLKLLESVITNTNDAVVISEAKSFDETGPRIIFVNEAYTKLTGYSQNEIIGKTPRILQGPKTDVKELARLKRHIERTEPCEVTLVNYKKTGEEYWVNFTINPVTNKHGKVTHWVSLQHDVTDKKQQEINMMKAIIKTQEDERYEIGGELHDNVCQILTSSQISLKLLKKYLPVNDQYRLNEGLEYIALATHEIRNLSHRLAPAFFIDTTIEEAFTNLIRSFNIEQKYDVFIYFDEAFKQQPARRDFQLNIYRILQEQLKNILKHAHATIIKVKGKVENNVLTLTVTDNGVGFNINQVKNGIGLANMKRRVELFSGKFNIQTATGLGCILTVEIPIKEII